MVDIPQKLLEPREDGYGLVRHALGHLLGISGEVGPRLLKQSEEHAAIKVFSAPGCKADKEALAVTFDGQLYEAVEQFFVGEAARGPEFRVDARRCEAGDGIYLVE